jgi:hypothetical protein
MWTCDIEDNIRLKPSDKVQKLYRIGDAYLPKHIVNILDYRFIGDDNTFYVDFWSITHFIWGIVIFFLLCKLTNWHVAIIYLIGFVLHTFWELF